MPRVQVVTVVAVIAVPILPMTTLPVTTNLLACTGAAKPLIITAPNVTAMKMAVAAVDLPSIQVPSVTATPAELAAGIPILRVRFVMPMCRVLATTTLMKAAVIVPAITARRVPLPETKTELLRGTVGTGAENTLPSTAPSVNLPGATPGKY